MKNLLFSGLSSLLLPMGVYAGPTAGASYQRTYLSSSINASAAALPQTYTALPRDLVDLSGDQLDIQVAHAVRELVVVDEGVAEADKAVLRRALKPGVEMVHIRSAAAGLPQLIAALEGHKNLAAIHVISHAEAGAILLGNSRITAENIQQEVHAFAALHGAVRNGGDLLFYGCDLAANKAGEDLLDIISNKTGLDVAASNNLTGNSDLQGDWDLEVKRGNVEAALAFSEKSLKDFSSVLVALDGKKDFVSGWTDNSASLTSTDFIVTAFDSGGSPITNISHVVPPPYTNAAYLQSGYNTTTTGTYFYVAADGTHTGSFELTGLEAGEYASGQFTNVRIVGIKPDNSTIASTAINGTGSAGETFTFSAAQLGGFSGVQLKAFKLVFDTSSASNTKPYFEFRNFTITGALAPSPTITSATYNASTGALFVTGTNFTATVGVTNDVDASDFTLTGEGGSTYALTDTADVEITSATSFTLMLSATDRAAANLIVNKTGTSSTGGTTYNLAGAAGFVAASAAAADLTANGITATVAAPTVTSATYDASTGALVVTATNLKKLSGATNEIIANKFTLRGEGGSTYTLTDTVNVEISSGTSFTLSLSATDRAGANLILNKNGTLSTDISTYNLAAAEDWNAGADAGVTIADTTGNGVTVSNVAAPTITSATYNASTGALVVTSTGLLKSNGATNDIVANKFTFSGQGGSTYALTDTSNVEVTSGTSFTLTLSSTDKDEVNLILNKNGTSSIDATTYNLAAADDWNAGADAAVAISDLTGNGITTSNALTAPDAPTIGTATAGDGQVSVAFSAPGSNGGSPVTSYTVISNPGSITNTGAGSPIVITGLTNGTAYTFTVTATNAIGTSTASGASNSVTPKGAQTITFGNPGAQNFGTTPTLSATATSSLTPTFSSSTTGVCTITSGGALTFVTAGSCTIDADQAGNTAWNAATTVTQTFTVNAVVPGAPTIGTATAGDTQATVTFTGPANMGGAALIPSGYTVTASPGGATATGSSSPITVTGLTNGLAYTFSVTATNSAGEGNASAASNAVTPAAPQAITFNNPGTQNFGTTPTLTATSDAGGGYPVSFTSSTTGVCTITAGGALTFVNVGSCTINADQAGDSSFLAAPQVSQTFTVAAVLPGAPTATAAIAGDTQASVAFTAPVFTGGTAITSYTVTVNPADVAPIAGAASPIVVTGLTNGQAYTFTVTADNVVGTGPASPASNSITPAATQTITFINPGAQNFGTTPTFTATADSGLTPTFTSSTTGVCTITSDGALTFVTIGNCTINADQAGNGSYLTAPQVTRTFAVNAVAPGAPTAAVATAGNASASVAFTAPVFAGGTGITGYTVTSNPGGLTGSGAGSPIAVTGLSNGVAYTFTVTATNPAGTSSPSAASNSVTPNGAPTIGGTPTLSVAQDVAYSFIPTANDTLGDTLTFSITNKPSWAAFNTATGALTGTPTNADIGSTTGIVISVNDGSLSDSLTAFDLTVTNVNDAPLISGTPATSVAQDAAYSFVPTASDIDVSDVLTFSIINKPTWANFDNTTGALTGTPTNADVGTTTGIVISVGDGTVSVDLATFNLSVTNVNEVPVISGTPLISVAQDVAYSFIPTASDVDVGDVLTYSISNKPTWAAFDTVTGALTGTPTNADIGSTTGIVISVSDGVLSASLAAFNLAVTNVNEAPTISGTPAISVAQDVAYSFIPTGNDVDVGDVLTFSITNKPIWAAFDTATGALTGTPTNANVGTTTGIVISVSDGTLSASLAAFNLAVTNVNEAPTITGTPVVSAAQDVAYSFIPTGDDVDVGDVLTYSIVNKPTWAAFDTVTGALTGTPVEADIGSTTGIVISVSDGTLSASLAAFNLTVTNTNEAPTITGTPTVSVAQDVVYSFIPTGNDVDVGDVLTYSIVNKPTWAAFDTVTGALTGTPVEADIGSTTGIVITVSDGTLSASLAAFNLAVTNTNEAPTITGTPTISVDQDVAYSFIPTGNDVDVGDVLTYSIVNKPTWAAFDTATGALTGTPTHDHVGTTTGIVISVSDGTLSADLPAFNLEVVETIDPLQPIVTAPADLVIDATALFTPVSLRQLLGLNASATQAQVDQLLAGMASDGVSGNTCCVTSPEGLNIRNVLLLRPGRHQVTWTATNAADVTGTAVQTIDVRPLASLSKSQIAIRGSAVEFRVLLNGKAPEYPVSVPYVIDTATTAGTNEHNLVNGVANFTEEGQVEVVVPVQLANLSGLSDSELVVRLDGDINAGVTNTHTIRIREGNIPPIALLQLSQGGVNTIQITPTGGPVTVTASVFDLNPGDTQAYDWSASDRVLGDTDGNPVNNTLVFDPSGLTGRHQAQVTVTDAGGATANAQLHFRIVASLPVLLPNTDTDADGVNDVDEGLGDSNNNGIPDYLDNMPSSNILPQAGNTTNSYLIECDPGVRCGLGKFALTGNSGGVQILNEELGTTGELIVDPAFEPVGGIFDFVINDLPTPGQSVRIVIPQQAAIPANATYRKYQNGVWVSFIENTNNAIFSAPGNPGYCPPPGTPDWTPGLTEGHLCVQLTIEDGGPNDDDGLVNSALADPGAVSVAEPVEPPPPPPPPVKPPVEIKSKGGGAMGGLWLLLLGGLLVLKRVKPVWITLAALVAASVNTQAADNSGFYLRADIAGITSSQAEDDFSNALSAAGHEFTVNHYDTSRSGFQLALGLQWEKHLYTELGYLDLGESKVNLTLAGDTDLNSFSQDFAANYPLSAEGLTLVQGIMLTPDAPIKVSAEVGVFVWRSEISIDQRVLSVDDDEGEDVLVGVKLDIPMSEKFGFGIGLRRIYFDDQEVNLYSMIGSYYF